MPRLRGPRRATRLDDLPLDDGERILAEPIRQSVGKATEGLTINQGLHILSSMPTGLPDRADLDHHDTSRN